MKVEYLSIWTGGSSDSWVDYDKLTKYRTIVNPEKYAKLEANSDGFYYISVDVARAGNGANSAISVFKVLPREQHFQKKLVNLITLHDMHFAL